MLNILIVNCITNNCI